MDYGKYQLEFFKNSGYLRPGETLEERIEEIVSVVRKYEDQYMEGLGDIIKEMIYNRELSPSTPQWANLGRKKIEGSNSQALPASCNIVSVTDSIAGIYGSHAEVAMLSKLGAGVGVNWMNVSETGTEVAKGFFTNDKMDWIEDSVRVTQKVSQNGIRRGYSVPFISIMDKSFYDLMKRADKTNPDTHDPLVDNNIGIILPLGFMERLKTDKEAQKRFILVMQQRKMKGKIYLMDMDNANKNMSPVYEKLNHVVDSTNICSEVLTPTYDDKTFVCVLASLNLQFWDKLKANPIKIKAAFMYLDICVSEYIRLTEGIPFMEKSRRSAIEKRDIGLGTLGFHDLLQSKGFAFGDMGARMLNKEIYKTIREIGEEYTKEIGEKVGSPSMCQEAGMVRRNVSLMMVAPNKSTSFTAGETSMGIEPFMSNYFVHELSSIHKVFKNPHLETLLDSKGKNTIDTWNGISKHQGSVAHLDFLTQEEKDIFKTASEISPKDMIDLAADRQEFIDMGQSLNLFDRPNYTIQDVYNIHKYGIEKGIKTFYYYYPSGHASINSESGESWDACIACAD